MRFVLVLFEIANPQSVSICDLIVLCLQLHFISVIHATKIQSFLCVTNPSLKCMLHDLPLNFTSETAHVHPF